MQERYLGDSYDFLKYSPLGHLSTATGVRLGANWYLTVPEQVDKAGNNDGQKRHHLKGGVWQQADPDLFERIQKFDPDDSRSLANVAELGLLPPNTIYYDAPVSTANRAGWHGIGAQTLRESDLVFLDPDNGLEVKSMTSRTRPKYALYEEVASYFKAGKAVVAIQFARQCDPLQRASEIGDKLVVLCGQCARLPVVRGRVAPNLLFFTIAPATISPRIHDALRTFATRCAKVDLIR
jgi:hypothetical protein